MDKLLKVSICIPTHNNEQSIDSCLNYIKLQSYPQELLEIIIIDGGSTDNTKQICKKYATTILNNPCRIEEKGRVIGINRACGDIVAFIDADNFIPDRDFLNKMVMPFREEKVGFSEPGFYSSREEDNLITKYVSLIGGDDPVAVYLGLYDRYCYFKGDWTDMPYVLVCAKQGYSVFKLADIQNMPPFGANGCFIRRELLYQVKYEPFLHTDVIQRILRKNNLFAKVHTGIIHVQSGRVFNFLKKKYRRASRRYPNLEREYYFEVTKLSIAYLAIKTTLITPLIFDAIIGYRKKRDVAWALHPFMVICVIFVYLAAFLRKIIRWN